MGFLRRLASIGINAYGDGKVSIPGFSPTIAAGKAWYLDPANGSANGTGTTPETACTSLDTLYAKLRTGKHDEIRFIAGSTEYNISSTSGFTWAKNCCHLVGEGSFNRMNQRSRIGHSVNMSGGTVPMFTVSGYGNSFRNLCFMHGRGSANNLIGVSVTGNRNAFINCHFSGPMHATEGDTVGYKLVNIAASENYFYGCTFGVDSISWDDGYAVYLATGGDNSPRVIFENCLFFMNAAGTPAVYFIGTQYDLGEASAIFLDCHFINSGSALTYAIDGSGLTNYIMYFDNSCSFVGCTDIVSATYESYVFCGGINMAVNQVNTTSSKLFNMLATNPDVS